MSQAEGTQTIDQFRSRVLQALEGMDPGRPVSATGIFQIKLDGESAFERMAAGLKDASRKSSGLIGFECRPRGGRAEGGAVEYLIHEDWATPAAFRAQWNSPQLKKFQSAVERLVVAPPEMKLHGGGPDGPLGVPRTGQQGAWDSLGNPVPAKGTGQDGEVRAGLPLPSARFSDNRDGTISDRLTGLTWLKDADSFGEVPLKQALQTARALASGSHGLADHSRPGDWRLPNIRELLSLIDFGSDQPPILPKGHPFRNVRAAIYWTSTTLAPAPHITWMMTLGIGPTVFDLKTSSNRMWPVRGNHSRVPKTGQKQCWDEHGAPLPECAGSGQDGELQAGWAPPDPRFTDNGDGTVSDNMTGLVWLKNANPFGLRTWAQALSLCNSLESGQAGLADGSSAGDWRLPNLREAESLVDYNEAGPCLTKGHPFTGLRPSSYWTSTTVTCAPTEAMFIIYGVGPAIFESKEHPFFVWPVRNKRPVR